MLFKRIKELRASNNFSSKEIAHYLDIKLSIYENRESGKVKIPISMVIKLCLLYDVSADYILELVDEKHPLPKE